MKKFLLSLAVALGAGISAFANDVTVTFSTLGYGNAEDVTTVTVDSNITLECAQGTSANPPKYYTTGNGLRMYNGNTMTITAASGYEITNITFTASANNYAVKGTVDTGTFTVSGAVSTWTGNASVIVLTSSATCRLQKMDITYTSSAPKDVEDVVISEVIENGEAVISLTCASEGATIKYGFSEDALDNVYSAPFTVTEKCTVYAQAELGGKTGVVSKKDIVLPAKFTSLKDMVDNAENAESIVAVGNFSVLYQSADGKYLIVTDGASNALVYLPSQSYEVGTKFSQMLGTCTIYGNLFEMTGATLTEGGDGAEYTPVEITDLSTIDINENIFDEIKITRCTVSDVSGKNATLTLGGKTIALYNTFGIDLENTDNATVTGFVWRYNDNLQIAPVSIVGKIVPVIANPVFEPQSTELNAGDEITITCETEGVNIYYTLDGEDPTEESILYDAPIVFTEDVTIKARAFSADAAVEMIPSEIVEAVYTLFDPNKPIALNVTFDFTTQEGLKEIFGADFEAPASGNGYNIEEPFSKDDVTITAVKNSNSGPRIWNTNDKFTFRTYKGDSFTISAPARYYIKNIEFTADKTNAISSDNYNSGVWEAPADQKEGEVIFNVTATIQISAITVTLDVKTGVESVKAGEGVAKYFDLNGRQVKGQLTNGLYIKVVDGKATKILVK